MKRLLLALAFSVISMCALTTVDTASATSKKVASAHKKDQKDKDIIVRVKAGDTLDSIAKKHHTTYVRLYNANKSILNPDVIDVGNKIKIPKKKQKLPNRFASFSSQQVAIAPALSQQNTTKQYTTSPVNSSSYYVGNGMWCTDYVHSRRSDVPIYGNAGYSWISAAKADGKSTGSTPKKGAVAVTSGHVAYVENVNKDGSYTVSEMGWNYQAGNYNKRTVKPGTFGGFIYK